MRNSSKVSQVLQHNTPKCTFFPLCNLLNVLLQSQGSLAFSAQPPHLFHLNLNVTRGLFYQTHQFAASHPVVHFNGDV